jgi:hypothetical protein
VRQSPAGQLLGGDEGHVGSPHPLGIVGEVEHEAHIAHEDLATTVPLHVLR